MPDTDLHVIAEIVAKPEHAAEVRALFTPFARGVVNEPGCKKYQFFESQKDAGHFFTVEIWSDRAALDAHMKTPEIAALVPKVSPLLAKPFVITPVNALTA